MNCKMISTEATLSRRVPARQPVYFVRRNKVDKMPGAPREPLNRIRYGWPLNLSRQTTGRAFEQQRPLILRGYGRLSTGA